MPQRRSRDGKQLPAMQTVSDRRYGVSKSESCIVCLATLEWKHDKGRTDRQSGIACSIWEAAGFRRIA